MPPGPAVGKQGRKEIVGWWALLLTSQPSIVLKSVRCKHAASAVFYRPVDFGSLLPSCGGCLGEKEPVLKSGAIDVYVAMRSPSSAHQWKGNEKGRTGGRQSRESSLLLTPCKEGEIALSHLPQGRERLQEEPCAGLDLAQPGHQPLLKSLWFALFPSFRMHQMWGSCHALKATCLICQRVILFVNPNGIPEA